MARSDQVTDPQIGFSAVVERLLISHRVTPIACQFDRPAMLHYERGLAASPPVSYKLMVGRRCVPPLLFFAAPKTPNGPITRLALVLDAA